MNPKVNGGKRTLRKSRGKKANNKSRRNRRRTAKTVAEKDLNTLMKGGSGAATHGVNVHGSHDQQFARGGGATPLAPAPVPATPAPEAVQNGGKGKKSKRTSSKKKSY